jgi:glutamine synthetase
MNLDELKDEVGRGAIDTVLLGFTDMQGRLQGKRLTAEFFLDSVVHHGAEGCNYLLAVDVDMNTVSGYAMSSWDLGYGDFEMKPDMDTLMRVPWHEGTALVIADLSWSDGSPVVASPRQILRRQIDRLAERGLQAYAGTELEFMIFRNTYEEAWNQAYRDLEPANYYNVDYSMIGTARVEPLVRRIRNSMAAAGMKVENAKGECNFGQHEINFLYGPVLQTADHHSIYKTGAKEIAHQEGVAITYMAKFDEREGNSCHIHLSVRDGDGTPRFDDAFLAGQLACLQDLTLFYGPNVNSYKRFVEGSFAPTAVAWGNDNRTCSLRVVGHGPSKRLELRLPGADVNPYLALSAMIAAGLHGLEQGLELEPPYEGNAYESDKPRVPATLRDARDAFAASDIAREAFGAEVVDHYLNYARIELDAFDRAVTDWERFRGFERL